MTTALRVGQVMMWNGYLWVNADIGDATGVYSVNDYDAEGDGTTDDVTAIQAAITAASAAGGVVLFPGGPETLYAIGSQLTVTASNVTLWAPGGARLKLLGTHTVALAVGGIDTGINLAQGNTLDADAASAALVLELTTGKGANFAAGDLVVIKSDAVIPEHDAAVTSKTAEFAIVYDVSGDDLELSRPLRYGYATADNAEVCKVTWIENFAIDGLGFDGNDQTACPQAVCLSWCRKPRVRGLHGKDLEQRLLRFQGCYEAFVDDLSQQNGLSDGFQGAVSKFAYMLTEASLNEGLVATNLRADRVRHGYTTGAGYITNAAVTSAIDLGGVPTNFTVGPGVHTNARGAGWDTHEVGVDGVLHDLTTIGGLTVGFQNRCVRTRIVSCHARNCIGAAIQLGSDSQNASLEKFSFRNCNLGTDEAGSTDWTVKSPIQDNGVGTYLDGAAHNEVDNGNFELWERGTSYTATGGTANRWKLTLGTGAGVTVSRQPHTVGTPGAVGNYFYRFNRTTTGSTVSTLSQYLGNDDVRHLAGQRAVVSFVSRTSSEPQLLNVYLKQYFGTGGVPSADVDSAVSSRELDDTFRRHSVVIDVPSITGKTVGSNEDSYTILVFELPTAEGEVFFDIDQVKLEMGTVPTQYIPEALAETKERCARWFEKSYSDGQSPGSASSLGNVSVADSIANALYYRRTVHMTTRKGRLPTVTTYAQGSGTASKVRNVTAGTDIDPSVSLVGPQSFHAGILNSGDVTAADVVQFSWVATVAEFE